MKGFAKNVENLFFPSNVAIAGSLILIIYFFNSQFALNNITVVVSSVFAYYILLRLTTHRIKSETKKFSTASSISLLLFIVLSVVFPLTKEVFIGGLAISIVNFFTHFTRDRFMLSSHMMTYATVLTILVWADRIFVVGALLLPLIAWSRLKLNKHSHKQILLGTIVGIVIPAVVISAS